MRVIDLLNKIANREKIPKIINYNGTLFRYNEGIDYENDDGTFLMGSAICICPEDLNDEVEIIEEHKIPEKLKTLNNVGNSGCLGEFKDKQHLNNNILKIKINEIIDYLKEQK